ncbi:glutathione S-transferase family protein [Rugamonas sp. CCM 8940]|jgi:glutathione S-transferase|uniref:glutathione S-transferase family protein n=1 Tax=Rugamonas sp. CCM 8940 TaxID=2765359 RepID=UPI0018F66B25|nr:glutathione S-transferase [Rugamonas sp. CCM 8940]MBJ7309373.1 glutathione S-transferase [Rugamonas sp. CCM 8940]
MIQLHHLKESRSRRITWLLEELGLDYEVISYDRDPVTRLAPPELARIHPLGKAPVLCDDGQVLIESGAVIEYLVRRYGQGRFAPAVDTPAYNRYIQLLHYAEGSAMLPLMLALYTGRLGEAAAPLQPRIQSEMKNHLGYLEGELAGREFFVGEELSGADIQLSFVVQMGVKFGGGAAVYPNLAAFVARIEALPAYQRAKARHGE